MKVMFHGNVNELEPHIKKGRFGLHQVSFNGYLVGGIKNIFSL